MWNCLTKWFMHIFISSIKHYRQLFLYYNFCTQLVEFVGTRITTSFSVFYWASEEREVHWGISGLRGRRWCLNKPQLFLINCCFIIMPGSRDLLFVKKYQHRLKLQTHLKHSTMGHSTSDLIYMYIFLEIPLITNKS